MSNEDSLVNKLLDRMCKRRNKIGISRSRRVKVFVEQLPILCLTLFRVGLAFFHRKSANFSIARKTDIYCILIRNL